MIQDVDPKNIPVGYTAVSLPADTSLGPPPKDPLEGITAVVVQNGEGDGGEFTIVHSSFEDATGIRILQLQLAKDGSPAFFSNMTYNAMVMVDAWNPVYSWRRGVLLQYVPDDAQLEVSTGRYDLDERFVTAVRSSPRCQDPDSPESEFLANLSQDAQDSFTSTVMPNYLQKVQAALGTQAGMADYLKLAESRRRIYRPLPLDEFALTLPYALKYQAGMYYEMRPDGTVQEMDNRGVTFFNNWRTSVSSCNPQLIPIPDADAADNALRLIASSTPTSRAKHPLGISCQQHSLSNKVKASGCPFIKVVRQQHSSMSSSSSVEVPTWDQDILPILTEPPWYPGSVDDRRAIAKHWKQRMLEFGATMPDGVNLTLDKYEHVKLQAWTIYQHCASRSMPITTDEHQYWPSEALETFREWINGGCRKTASDPVVPRVPLVKQLRDPKFFTRKDVRDLTSEEIQIYRAKLQDILRVDQLQSPWQELAELRK